MTNEMQITLKIQGLESQRSDLLQQLYGAADCENGGFSFRKLKRRIYRMDKQISILRRQL